MRDINIAITAASYSGNKGAAAMLQSGLGQLYEVYGHRLNVSLMSVYPDSDKEQVPFDFIKVIPCTPQKLLFVAFPLAILYAVFGWIPGVKRLFSRNKIIRAYAKTDLVIDMAGVAFVDSRGFVMNTYAFVCAIVPMLVGTPVVKYSQALGSFDNLWNRLLAKIALKRMKLICARGKITYDNLKSIGVEKNVVLAADGAFTMPDDELVKGDVKIVTSADPFFKGDFTGISLSSVVEKKCAALGKDYAGVMADFINNLNDSGEKVFIIANAAREGKESTRNNDLPICRKVYAMVNNHEMTRFIDKEMKPEEIREYIGLARYLIISRFHAMIGALQRKKPILLIGWSHKYTEVMEMFGLGQQSVDFSQLSADILSEKYEELKKNEKSIISSIEEHYEEVMDSSRDNIRLISPIIDFYSGDGAKKKKYPLDLNDPDKYIGSHFACRKAYASNPDIRANAASGGAVTAFLEFLLEKRIIDGAWVSRILIKEGKLGYETFIAESADELRSASSSIYMDIPLLSHIEMIKQFKGKVAVVMTPCMLSAFSAICEKDKELADKVVIRLGLFCCGNHSPAATELPLKKLGITLDGAKRLYYKRGHWRGRSSVIYDDGREVSFSYQHGIMVYKNAFFFEKPSCMLCRDHYAFASDISFGDIWLNEMKKESIKHNSCVFRNEEVYLLWKQAVKEGFLIDGHISDEEMIRGQKRALVFKYLASPGRQNDDETSTPRRWNHKLCFYLAEKNRRYSIEHYDRLARKPIGLMYLYMCFIRLLLSF